MVKKLTRLLIVLVVCQMMSLASAQAPDEPLYLLYENQLWEWSSDNSEVSPIGDPLPNAVQSMSMSPSNDFFVYQVRPQLILDLIQQEGGVGGGDLPSDLWLLDLATGDAQLIAGQPEDLTIETAYLGTVRSKPIWSPDGMMLAWSEGTEGGNLIVFDIVTGETRTLADNLPAFGLVPLSTPLMAWTRHGILVKHTVFDVDSAGEQESTSSVLIYALDGRMREIQFPYADIATLLSARIVHRNDQVLLALNYPTSWEFIDIATGEAVDIQNGTFVSIAQNHADTSLRISPQILDGDEVITEVYAPDNSLLILLQTSGVTMSPSGRALTYKWVADTLTYSGWSADSGEFTITLPWQPFVRFWGTRETVIMDTDNPLIVGAHCKGSSLRFGLQVGQTGYVSDTTANNIRTEPNANSDRLGAIPANDWFTVLGGPVCHDGIAWWQVDYPPYEGWTAEGQGLDRWLTSGCPETGCGRG